jgi:hypothetical protein
MRASTLAEVPEVVIRVGVIRATAVPGAGVLRTRIRTRMIQEGGQDPGQGIMYDGNAPPTIEARLLPEEDETTPLQRPIDPRGDETRAQDYLRDDRTRLPHVAFLAKRVALIVAQRLVIIDRQREGGIAIRIQRIAGNDLGALRVEIRMWLAWR